MGIDIRDKELVDKIFDEIRYKAKVSLDDDTVATRTRLLDLLSKEITEVSLNDEVRDRVKTKLGEQGDLPLSKYKIIFPPFFQDFEADGIRKQFIVDAIKEPQFVEHLLPENSSARNAPAVTFVSQVTRKKYESETFTLLVETQRTKSNLDIMSAWRVYHSDTNANQYSRPLEVLEAFTSKYGCEIEIKNRVPSKLIVYEAVLLQSGVDPMHALSVHMPKEKAEIRQRIIARLSTLSVLEIAIGYAINITKYRQDIRRHGVQIN